MKRRHRESLAEMDAREARFRAAKDIVERYDRRECTAAERDWAVDEMWRTCNSPADPQRPYPHTYSI